MGVETGTPAALAITKSVRSLYERHPYPRYPLFAKPRWVEGYLTPSLFSHRLVADLTGEVPDLRGVAGRTNASMKILLAGAGEILPYIVRTWEPWQHQVIALDLSQPSLDRAKLRLTFDPKPKRYVCADLEAYLARTLGASFGHIDLFGVLHHLPNPGRTLDLLSHSLSPGGTARIMVYNADARLWIHHLQKLFQTLAISPHAEKDLAFARTLLQSLRRWCPALHLHLSHMGAGTMGNDARFADTFLHPRECRHDLSWWLQRIAQAGLEPIGMLDRYGELDDLPNPLWSVPKIEDLALRAEDRRLEGNLELFVRRPGGIPQASQGWRMKSRRGFNHWNTLRHGPPRFWFSFEETRTLGPRTRLLLWDAWLAWVFMGRVTHMHHLTRTLPFPALQRLTRLGALFPGQIQNDSLKKEIASPLSLDVAPPQLPATKEPRPDEALGLMATWLHSQGRMHPRRLAACEERVKRLSLVSPQAVSA